MRQWVLSAMLCALLTVPALGQRGGGGRGGMGGGHGFAGGGHGFSGGGMAARPSGGYGYRAPGGYGYRAPGGYAHVPYAGGARPAWGGNNWHGNNWNGNGWNGNNWGWHNNGWHGNGWGWHGNNWGWGWRGRGWWWPGWGWGWGSWWWPSWGWGGWWWPSWGWGGTWDNTAYYPSDVYAASDYQASNYQAQNYPTYSYVTPEYSSGYSQGNYPPDTRTQDQIDSLRSEVDQLRAQQEAQSAAAANPQIHAETVLVYKDGHTEQVRDYAIVGRTLWVFNEARARKIALSELDLPATKRDNEDRGVEFVVPSSR